MSGITFPILRGPLAGKKWLLASRSNFFWGTYEPEQTQAFQKTIRPGDVVFDVGAHYGYYTLLSSELAGPKGKVFAFEPCAYEARFLIDHVRLNHLDNVRVVQAAVCETRELLPMSSDRGMCENRLGDDPGATLMVPTISLDSSGLPVPDLIKMDVEGAEAAVLRGAHRTLREARPVLFVALHGNEQRKTCAIILRDAGYSIYGLDGQRISVAPSVDEIYALPVEARTMPPVDAHTT